ncbi:MAG: ribulose-phosphate 3-epimerase [Bacilli bacterium]
MKDKGMFISCSLSCVDLMNLEKSIEEINHSSIDYIHYDVVDGEFNNCFIFGDIILEKVKSFTKKPIEVHLACNNVEKYLIPFAKAGADYIAIHYETTNNIKEMFSLIKSLNVKPILAFRADTEVPDNFVDLARDVEWILKLTVNPGFAGQKIQKQAIEHIHKMNDLIEKHHLSTKIQADGNINVNTIPEVVKAGATILTGGSSGLFNNTGDLETNIIKMLEAANYE